MTETGRRIIVRTTGGPEQLEIEEFALTPPTAGHVRIRIGAIGVNFIDIYHRSGLYPQAMPTGIGLEAIGVIEAVGSGVKDYAVGDNVGVMASVPSCYATHITIDADRLIPVPSTIPADIAAAVLLKGLTAWMLLEQCARVKKEDVVLVHSAAGGVGSLVVPWAKALGATVIAHAGSAAKAEKARLAGADYSLSVSFEELPSHVREITEGRGADVILDGVGAASWSASLASIRPRGLLVSYGNASGAVPPVSLLDIGKAGSIFVTRPTVFHYTTTIEERRQGAERLFELIAAGTLNADIGQRFPLAEAGEAHRALESRRTTGSTILLP